MGVKKSDHEVRVLFDRIPGWDSDAPDNLSGDRPVVHNFHPAMVFGLLPFRVDFYLPIFDYLMSRFLEIGDFDKPVREDGRFDIMAGFVADSYGVSIVGIDFFDEVFSFQVGGDNPTRMRDGHALVRTGEFIEFAIEVNNAFDIKFMAFTGFKVIGIMSRSDFNYSSTEFGIDHVVGDNFEVEFF